MKKSLGEGLIPKKVLGNRMWLRLVEGRQVEYTKEIETRKRPSTGLEDFRVYEFLGLRMRRFGGKVPVRWELQGLIS